jgi:excisionase family DNA binding protein
VAEEEGVVSRIKERYGEFLSLKQLAEVLGIGMTTAWRLVKSGRIHSIRHNPTDRSKYFVPESAVEEYLDRRLAIARAADRVQRRGYGGVKSTARAVKGPVERQVVEDESELRMLAEAGKLPGRLS